MITKRNDLKVELMILTVCHISCYFNGGNDDLKGELMTGVCLEIGDFKGGIDMN